MIVRLTLILITTNNILIVISSIVCQALSAVCLKYYILWYHQS